MVHQIWLVIQGTINFGAIIRSMGVHTGANSIKLLGIKHVCSLNVENSDYKNE